MDGGAAKCIWIVRQAEAEPPFAIRPSQQCGLPENAHVHGPWANHRTERHDHHPYTPYRSAPEITAGISEPASSPNPGGAQPEAGAVGTGADQCQYWVDGGAFGPARCGHSQAMHGKGGITDHEFDPPVSPTATRDVTGAAHNGRTAFSFTSNAADWESGKVSMPFIEAMKAEIARLREQVSHERAAVRGALERADEFEAQLAISRKVARDILREKDHAEDIRDAAVSALHHHTDCNAAKALAVAVRVKDAALRACLKDLTDVHEQLISTDNTGRHRGATHPNCWYVERIAQIRSAITTPPSEQPAHADGHGVPDDATLHDPMLACCRRWVKDIPGSVAKHYLWLHQRNLRLDVAEGLLSHALSALQSVDHVDHCVPGTWEIRVGHFLRERTVTPPEATGWGSP